MADGQCNGTDLGQFVEAQDGALQGVIMFKSKRIRAQAPRSARRGTRKPSAVEKKAKINPVAALMFGRKFPGVTLVFFNVLRPELHPALGLIRNVNVINFEGPIEMLLHYGLIDSDMIPPGRKRYSAGFRWPGEGNTGSWYTERAPGGLLVVHRDLCEDFDRNHPLAPFGVWHWQTFLDLNQQAA